jgi:RNA polymerase sigma factor (sigma-70 family)
MTTSAPVRHATDGGDVDVGIPRQSEDGREPDPRAVNAAEANTLWDAAARCFKAWKDGDPSALDELVRRVTPVLWQVIRAYGLDRASAEDVVQNTWMTLIRKSEQVRDDQAVLRWLTTTARREAWRTATHSGRANPTEDVVIETALPTARSPEAEVLESDLHRELWRNVHLLDARCQKLLRIVAFEDRPDYASLAKELNMPMGSIGPTRSRCLGKLRNLMTANEGSRR